MTLLEVNGSGPEIDVQPQLAEEKGKQTQLELGEEVRNVLSSLIVMTQLEVSGSGPEIGVQQQLAEEKGKQTQLELGEEVRKIAECVVACQRSSSKLEEVRRIWPSLRNTWKWQQGCWESCYASAVTWLLI